jgi:AsmA protein
LDVDAFLPKSQVSPEPVPSASNEPVKIELPEALIKDLDVAGRLAIGQLKVKGLEPKNLQLSLLAKSGQVKAALNQAALLDGSIRAKATLDVRGKQPAYQLDAQVEKIPIEPLLKAFAGTDMLSGQGRVKLALTTAGRDTQALMNNLNGPGELRLVDGAVKGFNLAQSIRKAKAKLSSDSQATTQATETLQTDFSELQGAFVFKQGVMQLTQMQAVAPYMRVNASGHVDLPASQLNLKVNAKIVNSDEGQGGEAFNDLKGLTLPIALKGPLTSPKVSLELTSVLKDKAKQQLEAEKAKAKAKLEEKKEAVAEELKEKVQEKFKSLFKF